MQTEHYVMNERYRPSTLDGYVCDDTFKQKVNKHNKNTEKDVEILHENEKKVEKLEKMNENEDAKINLL